VQPTVPIRTGQGEGWVLGHAPDDVSLHPQDQFDFTKEQLAVILTAKAKEQVAKHLRGKSTRVTGRVTSYLPFTDDPISARQYDVVASD
jgi:hypothetical protein